MVSEQIYEHMAKWRRVLRDLAVEAGLKRFVKPSDAHDKTPSTNPESSKLIQPRDQK